MSGINFDKVQEYIEQGKENLDKIDKKDIIILMGETGAGKTTSILHLAKIPMIKDTSGYQPSEVVPGFEVGSDYRSITKCIGVKVIEDMIFVDSPGFKDTKGHEVEIANSCTIASVLKNCNSIVPILVINYSTFLSARGTEFRLLLQHIHSLFGGNMKILEDALCVFITHAAPDLTVKDLEIIFKKISQEEDAVENTDAVLDMVELLETLITKRKYKNRISIINPTDMDEADDLLDTIKNKVTPITNPSLYIKYTLTDRAHHVLSSSLNDIKHNIPKWLEEGNQKKILNYFNILNELKDSIDQINPILQYCANNVQTIVKKTEESVKQRFEDLLTTDIWNTKDVHQLLEYRTILDSVSQMTQYFTEEIETVGKLDDWITHGINKLEIRYCNPVQFKFDALRMVVEKLGKLKPQFPFIIAIRDTEAALIEFIKSQFASIQDSLSKLPLRKANLDKLFSTLEALKTAIQEVAEIVQTNQNLIETTVRDLTRIFQSEQAKLIKVINNSVEEFDNNQLDTFAFFRAFPKHENLRVYFTLTDSQTLYDNIRVKLVTRCDSILNQLETIIKSLGIQDNTESIDKQLDLLQKLSSADSSVKSEFSIRVNQLILSFEMQVELSFNVLEDELYAETPIYKNVALHLQKLNSLKWIDKYTYGSNRVSLKYNEAIEKIGESVGSIFPKIKSSWGRKRYVDVKKLYGKYGELSALCKLIPSLVTMQNNSKEFIETELSGIFQGVKNTLEAKSGFSIKECLEEIASLERLLDISEELGYEQEYTNTIKEIKRYVELKLMEYQRKIVENEQSLETFDIDLQILDITKEFQDSNSSHFSKAQINTYDTCKIQVMNKVHRIATEIHSHLENNNLLDGNKQFNSFSKAVLLFQHINNIQDTINNLRVSYVQQNNNSPAFINEALKNNSTDYNAIKEQLQQLDSKTLPYIRSINSITAFINSVQSSLQSSVSVFRPLNEDFSVNPKIDDITNSISLLRKLVDSFGQLENIEISLNLAEVYKSLDFKITKEVEANEVRLKNHRFVDAEISNFTLEGLVNKLNSENIPGTRSALATFKKYRVRELDLLESKIQNYLENNNPNRVNKLYESLVNVVSVYPQLIYGEYQQDFSSFVAKFFQAKHSEIKQMDAFVVANHRLGQLQNTVSELHEDLRGVVKIHLDNAQHDIDNRLEDRQNKFNNAFESRDFKVANNVLQESKKDPKLYQKLKVKVMNEFNNLFSEISQIILSNTFDQRIHLLLNGLELFKQDLPECYDNSVIQQCKSFKEDILKRFNDSVTRASIYFAGENDSPSTFEELCLSIVFYGSIQFEGAYIVQKREPIQEVFLSIANVVSNINRDMEHALLQLNFAQIAKSIQTSKIFSPCLLKLKNELTSKKIQEAASLSIVLDNWKPFQNQFQLVDQWASSLLQVVTEAWANGDFPKVEKILKSFVNSQHDSLKSLFPKIVQIASDIRNEVESRYNSIILNAERSWEDNNMEEFTKNYSLAEKLSNIEQLLNKSGILRLKKGITSKINVIYERSLDAIKLRDIDDISNNLLQLIEVVDNIPVVKHEIYREVNILIDKFGSNCGNQKLLELGLKLENRGRFGKEITRDFSQFAEVQRMMWIRKTQGRNIQWAVERFIVSRDSTPQGLWDKVKALIQVNDQKKTIQKYQDFEKQFQKIVQELLSGVSSLKQIVQSTKSILSKRNFDLNEVLVNLFAVWSITKSGNRSGSIFLQPHPIQILSLYRLLETGADRKYINQLVEILTGEGKSVILGISATFFALRDFEVSCICYSEYLSLRDYQDFLPVFEEFGVQSLITYSTVNQICELSINNNGNVRDIATSFLSAQANPNNSNVRVNINNRQKLLLIDEVDVFFGPDFYGKTYNPAALLKCDETFALLKFIWQNKANINLHNIKQTQQYNSLTQKFPNWVALIDSEILKMIRDVNKHNDPVPHKPILNNKIGYKILDQISYTTVYGYRTAFAYFNAVAEGDISGEDQIQTSVGIYIGCGNFSYAEIPTRFNVIMGVSGTLSCLSAKEKEIIQNYGIKQLAYAPSMYGGDDPNEVEGKDTTRRKFDIKDDVYLFNTIDTWFLRIVQHARDKQDAGRAVLIFFENKDLLDQFRTNFASSFSSLKELHEGVEFKDNVIRKSTTTGSVTLCTRPFGRGVDFICLDDLTKANGGVHVIQTFFASSEAEEVQIKGRTARQGDPGSYELILYEDHLGKIGVTKALTDAEKERTMLYNHLCTARSAHHLKEVSELIQKAQNCKQQHDITSDFLKMLTSYDGSANASASLLAAILELNKSTIIQQTNISRYHIYFCLDDSGSMSGSPWNDLIGAVKAFVDRRIVISQNAGVAPGDLVTIVNYSSNAQVMCASVPITSSPHLKTSFRDGGTDFAKGLKMVHQEMKKLAADYTPVLLFMSDGGCGNGNHEITILSRDFTPKGLKIFVVGFGHGCDHNKLKQMAQISGGTYLFGIDGAELKSSFENISVKISDDTFSLG